MVTLLMVYYYWGSHLLAKLFLLTAKSLKIDVACECSIIALGSRAIVTTTAGQLSKSGDSGR